MKEQLIVLPEQMSYPRNRENTAMPDSSNQEQLPEQAQPEKTQQELKKEQDERKAKRGMWLYVKRKAKEEKAKQENKQAEKEKGPLANGNGESGGAKDPTKYFHKTPEALKEQIKQFCEEAQGLDIARLETDFLTYHYLILRKDAKSKGINPDDFLAKIKTEIESRTGQVKVQALAEESDKLVDAPLSGNVDTDRLTKMWDVAIRMGKTQEEAGAKITLGLVPENRGGSQAITVAQNEGEEEFRYSDLSIGGTRDEILNNIVEQLNGWANDLRKDQSKVQEQIQRIQGLLDERKVNKEAAFRLINALEEWQRTGRRQETRDRTSAQKDEIERREKERDEEEYGSFYYERRIKGTEKKEVEEAINKILALEARGVKSREPMEALFNRMFDYADSNPQKEFDRALGTAGSQEHHHWTTMLNEMRSKTSKEIAQATDEEKKELIRRLDLIDGFVQRYSHEYRLRELLHNTYYIVETGGDPKNFVEYSSQFLSEFADLALSEAPEVEIAYRIREQVLYQIKRENNGTIPPESVALIYHEARDRYESEFERRSKELLRKTLKANGMDIPLWKVDRALSVSRGLGMVLLRWPEIVAECTLQAPEEVNESQPSIPWEKLAWELNPLDHKIKRYKVAREMRTILYAAVNRNKGRFDFWNQDELKESVEFGAITALANWDKGDGKVRDRIIDLRNLSRIGGWATYSGWRSWVSALEREGGNVSLALADLQKNLGRNPGLAIRLLWNRYELKDMGRLKKEFLKEWGYKQGKDENSAEAIAAWEERKKEYEKALKRGDSSMEQEWRREDMETWKNSARRIPHVILRILTDESNKIYSKAEIKTLLTSIFGNLPEAELKKVYTQTEEDLTLAKERAMKRRRDKRELIEDKKRRGERVLEEDEFKEEDDQIKRREDLEEVIRATAEGESEKSIQNRIERAWGLKEVVTARLGEEKLQKILFEKMSSREFAFALTTEDTPLGEFRFVQTGARGLITRRNNDFLQEVQANGAIEELLKTFNIYQKPEQIVEQLVKIFKFSEVHDYDRALELVEFLAKGIIRMNQKDGMLKFPILGEIMAAANWMKGRGESFAETAYGRAAMNWDSDDIYSFTEHLRKAIFIGEPGKVIVDRIRKETGGMLWQALGKKTKVGLYLFMLFFSYEFMQKLAKGK